MKPDKVIQAISEEWQRVEMENDDQAKQFIEHTLKPYFLEHKALQGWLRSMVFMERNKKSMEPVKIIYDAICGVFSSINQNEEIEKKYEVFKASFEKAKDESSTLENQNQHIMAFAEMYLEYENQSSTKLKKENEFTSKMLDTYREILSLYPLDYQLLMYLVRESITQNSEELDRYLEVKKITNFDDFHHPWEMTHKMIMHLRLCGSKTSQEIESERIWVSLPTISFHQERNGHLWKYASIEKKANKGTFPGLIGSYINANPECIELGIRLDELKKYRENHKKEVPEVILNPDGLKKKVLDLNKAFKKAFHAPNETFIQNKAPYETKGVFLTFTNPRRWQKQPKIPK